MTLNKFLKTIGRDPTTYNNLFPKRYCALLSERQAKYVEYIIVKIDMANLGMSRNEVTQVVSDI